MHLFDYWKETISQAGQIGKQPVRGVMKKNIYSKKWTDVKSL